MKLKGDWYFDGYEGRSVPGADGRPRRQLVYTGEYYGLAGGRNPRTLKLLSTAAAAVYLGCYILCAMNRCAVSLTVYAGVPVMLSVIPAFWLLIGLGCLWPAGTEMTVRVFYSSLRRMQRAVLFIVPLLGIGLVGSLVRLILEPALFASPSDLLYTLYTAAAFGSAVFELLLLKKNPVVVVRDPQPGSLRIGELEETQRKKKK